MSSLIKFPTEFPILRTKRLVLRQITMADAHAVHLGLSDSVLTRFYAVHYPTLDDVLREQMNFYADQWNGKKGIWWALSLGSEPNVLIGTIGLYDAHPAHGSAEFGGWLLPTHWRQGLMTEASQAVLEYGFQHMGLHRALAWVESENVPSLSWIKKLGFQHEGTLRQAEWKNQRWIDVEAWGLLADEFAGLE
jgi:ribosomal-protein-alanine N-acetyltransferase